MGEIPVSCFVYYMVMNKITLCPQNFPDTVFAQALPVYLPNVETERKKETDQTKNQPTWLGTL